MRCFYCGYEEEKGTVCPNCGADLLAYKRIMVASALCYNEGLRKAGLRDLSGAVDELVQSLKYNKFNTEARNLLGLCYFEIGEPVKALGEWVISKNLSPRDNLADTYLSKVNGSPALLNSIDESIKKYNLAVDYVRHKDLDLAKIQLKRLVAKQPHMIRAKSLLALIYYHDEEYKAALRELTAITKIDNGNATVNGYLEEVKNALKTKGDSSKKKKGEIDTEEMKNPGSSRFNYVMDYSKVSVVNIIIGATLGVLVSLFLIFPTIKQNSNDDAWTALLEANDDARTNENNIDLLRREIEDLKGELENYEGRADVKASYENLILAMAATSSSDMEGALGHFANVTRELLDTEGLKSYEQLDASITAYNVANSYTLAKELGATEDLEAAVEAYLFVVGYDESYDSGQALYELATCYEKLGEKENAVTFYTKVTELFEGQRIARRAKSKVEELS